MLPSLVPFEADGDHCDGVGNPEQKEYHYITRNIMNISVKNDFSICTVHFFSWDTYLTFQLKVKDLGKFNGLTNSSIWQLCGRDFQHFSFSTFQMNRQMLFLAVVASIMSLLVAQVVSHPGVNPYPNPLSQQDRKVSTTCSSEKISVTILYIRLKSIYAHDVASLINLTCFIAYWSIKRQRNPV